LVQAFPRATNGEHEVSANAAETGAKVLAALAEGRRKRLDDEAARVAKLEREVRSAIDIDLLSGHAEWGRAGRIARRLGVPRRTVAKYLARLSSRANSSA
jgi:hypothetical protein